jgi:hypothetical protein
VGTAKRGIAIKSEMQTEIYRMSRLAGISENKVIVRMLQIAREDLAAFDDLGLKRILREPWHIARKYPGLGAQLRKRGQRLPTKLEARLTSAQKMVVREIAKREKTTMSAVQRQAIDQVIAGRDDS